MAEKRFDVQDDVAFDEEAVSGDEDAPEDGKASKSSKPRKKKLKGEDLARDTRERAELELLMLDDSKLAAAKEGINVLGTKAKAADAEDGKKRLSRKQLMASKKEQRKRAKDRRDSDDDEEFDPDIEDPRFMVRTLSLKHMMLLSLNSFEFVSETETMCWVHFHPL